MVAVLLLCASSWASAACDVSCQLMQTNGDCHAQTSSSHASMNMPGMAMSAERGQGMDSVQAAGSATVQISGMGDCAHRICSQTTVMSNPVHEADSSGVDFALSVPAHVPSLLWAAIPTATAAAGVLYEPLRLANHPRNPSGLDGLFVTLRI
jgi:hypothetical protein